MYSFIVSQFMKNCFLPIFLAVVGLGSCAATSENGQVASEESLTDVLYQCVDSITIEQGVPRVENEEENEKQNEEIQKEKKEEKFIYQKMILI